MRSRKLIYILALVGLILANSMYISHELMIVLIVVVVVGAFCFIVQKLSVMRGELYVKFNRNRITCGESIKVGAIFDNHFIVKTPWARASVIIRTSDGEFETRNVGLNIYDKLRRFIKAEFYIKPVHSGVVYLHMEQLEVRDYLHMFSTRMRFDYVRKAYVFPVLIKADTSESGEVQQDASDTISYKRRESDEIVELREYREGDSIRRIHWNLSTINDDYIVKQYGEEADNREYIFVDLSLYDDDEFRNNLDRVYQWTYSIATRVVERGGAVVLLAWDSSIGDVYECEASNIETLDDCMEGLMDIKCSKDALAKLDGAMVHREKQYVNMPIVITGNNYESDIYRIMKVEEDSNSLLEYLKEI